MAYSRDKKPHVPAGWVACWDDSQDIWYFANLSTQKSQWQAPEGTFFPPENSLPPYEETVQIGAKETTNQSSKLPSLQGQNEHMNLRKCQQVSKSDAVSTSPLSFEMFDFKPPPLIPELTLLETAVNMIAGLLAGFVMLAILILFFTRWI